MRTTVTLDDELLAKARLYTGVEEPSALVRLALKTLVELEASRRLAALGGSDPEASAGPRKRPMAA
jgi:Arc/MetJ family transcription regulator